MRGRILRIAPLGGTTAAPAPQEQEPAVSDPVAEPMLGEYLLDWLERRVSQLRPTTVHGYRQLI